LCVGVIVAGLFAWLMLGLFVVCVTCVLELGLFYLEPDFEDFLGRGGTANLLISRLFTELVDVRLLSIRLLSTVLFLSFNLLVIILSQI
jgi:hypothetical protein